MYGGLAAGLLVLALAAALLPGPFDGTSTTKQTGYYLLPWGLGAGLLALMFAIPFTRHETDDTLRNAALNCAFWPWAACCVWASWPWGCSSPTPSPGAAWCWRCWGSGSSARIWGRSIRPKGWATR